MIEGILIGAYIAIAIVTGMFCMFFNVLGDERNWLISSLLGGIFWPITWGLLFNKK